MMTIILNMLFRRPHHSDSLIKNLYYKIIGVPHIGTRIRGCTVFKLLNLKKGSNILDIGAGSGVFSFEMMKRGYNVIRCDLLLGITREEIGEYNRTFIKAGFKSPFVQANATSIPFKDESFDGVLCADILEHIPEEGRALEEIRRILKKGGILVASTPAIGFHKGKFKSFFRVLYEKTFLKKLDIWDELHLYPERMMKEKGHLREYSLEMWKERCEKYGFELEDYEWQYKFFGAFFVELSHTFKVFGTMKWYQGLIFLLFYPIVKIDALLPLKLKGTGIAIRARKI